MEAQLIRIEREAEKLLPRILDVSEPRLIAACEESVRELEAEKIVTRERMARAARSFDDTPGTALASLANPSSFQRSDNLGDKKAVLNPRFADRLRHARIEGLERQIYPYHSRP